VSTAQLSGPQVRSTATAVLDNPAEGTDVMRRLAGRAVPYETPANIGPFMETISPGAFRESIAKTPRLPLLTYHDDKFDPVGVSTSWTEHRDGLHGTWQLDTSARAQEAARLVRDGSCRSCRSGFSRSRSTGQSRSAAIKYASTPRG